MIAIRPHALLVSMLLATTVCAARGAAADEDAPVAEAKEHFHSGIALLKSENYAGAAIEFEESLTLYPTANALFNLANCQEALHRYAQALESFERLLTEFDDSVSDEMRAAAERHRDEIRDLVAELSIEVDVDGATISVSGSKVGESPLTAPVILGPGEFEIEVSHDGYSTARRSVKLVSRTTQLESFTLEPLPQPPAEASVPSPPPEPAPEPAPDPPPPVDEPGGAWRPSALFWTGLGLTAATAVAAGAFWGLTDREHDEFTKLNARVESGELQPDDPELDELRATRDNGEMYQNLAIGFGVGAGAFAVASAVILIVDLRRDEAAPVKVSAAPEGLAISF